MSKRGSVFRRPDSPNWQAKVIIRGKRYTKGGFTTKAAAQSWIDQQYQKVERAEVLGLPVVRDDVLFEDLLPKWRRALRPRVSEKTFAGYTKVVEGILLPFFEGYQLGEITPGEIEEFLAERTERGVKPATLNRNLTVLSSILEHARKLGLVRENPVRRVERGREQLLPPRYLTPDEEIRLLVALPSWLRPPAIVALDAGLRAGEIGALTRRDVDFTKGMITVRESKNREPRQVAMTARLREVLEEHLKGLPKGHDVIFDVPDGPSVAKYEYRRPFESAVKRIGIGPFRWHDLRHAAGVRMAEAGATPAEIAAVLGHKTLVMTMRYIRHAPRDAARSVANLLDEARQREGKRRSS